MLPATLPGRFARLVPAAVGLVLLLTVAACNEGETVPPAIPGTPPAASSPLPNGTPAPGTEAPTSPEPVFDPAGLTLDLVVVADGLDRPLDIDHAGDGSGRLFIAEQGGRIWILRDGQRAEQPFLDISDRITAGGERGLLGLSFHPRFPADPRFFVNYTDRDGNTIVASFRVSEDPDVADPRSEEAILRIEQPFGNHNGGAVVFGPDGYLYISTGDGGSAGDPRDAGQRLDTLLGKILRIDVDRATGERPYAIPSDNPFTERPDAAPEIWLYGLRNPWRISFDRKTGDLWISDVGQNRYEEVNTHRAGAPAGANFGWARMEGFHCYPAGADCDPDAFTLPVTAYGHDLGCSVTGGVVYRGESLPRLEGAYLFSDYCSGNIWAIPSTQDVVRDPAIVERSGRSIAAFGEDEAGEVHVVDISGGVLLRVTVGS
jgi:glucose/arabinose dehydrogenase